jgi:hypothetical protein
MDIFDLEVKEKKNQAYLNRARTGSKGGSKSRKGMNTPYDFMDKRERKKLNSEVRTSNMYETVLTKDEFFLKDVDTQKLMLTRWRELYPNDKIKKDMGLHNAGFYNLVEELDLPKKIRGGANNTAENKEKKTRKAKVTPVSPKPTLLDFAVEPEVKKEIEKEVVKTMLISKGLHLEYNGNYDVEALSKIFTKLQLIIDGDSNKYNISLSLTEIVED